MKATTVRINDDTIERIDCLANTLSRSRSWVINQAIERFLDYEEWFVFPVDNVSDNKNFEWKPDRKQMQQIKRKAKKLELTRIGNIHSHPLEKNSHLNLEELIEYARRPSNDDLKYAKKYNDIVRGILLVDNDAVYAHCFHDQFGNELSGLYLNGINKRLILLEVISNE